jgi:hypothetical protein
MISVLIDHRHETSAPHPRVPGLQPELRKWGSQHQHACESSSARTGAFRHPGKPVGLSLWPPHEGGRGLYQSGR